MSLICQKSPNLLTFVLGSKQYLTKFPEMVIKDKRHRAKRNRSINYSVKPVVSMEAVEDFRD